MKAPSVDANSSSDGRGKEQFEVEKTVNHPSPVHHASPLSVTASKFWARKVVRARWQLGQALVNQPKNVNKVQILT